ncbi:MAG: adenylate/guanylate cyclase domain-containing protein [Rhodospirillaceae bacterium]|nr:adenylate/guanylate cyclase domain-containing protein [Rhodospirillaceae bacterium]
MERRLSAILAADVVGFASHNERDEAGTFERLRSHRKDLFEPEIARHHGRIFKLMGDGLLAEFGSVVEAVECAVALQRGMTERNDDVAADKRIDVRIGINLGDVIIEGEDRHGEGVVIASRLQQLAKPGGIAVSGTVMEHVRRKLALRFEPIGEHQVKNIAAPVSVYRVPLDVIVPAAQKGGRRYATWAAIAIAGCCSSRAPVPPGDSSTTRFRRASGSGANEPAGTGGQGRRYSRERARCRAGTAARSGNPGDRGAAVPGSVRWPDRKRSGQGNGRAVPERPGDISRVGGHLRNVLLRLCRQADSGDRAGDGRTIRH